MNKNEFIEIIKESIEINRDFIRKFTKKHPLGKGDLAYFLKNGYIHPFYYVKIKKEKRWKQRKK